MKKYIIFMFLIFLVIIVFIFSINKAKDYTVEYNVGDMVVEESYNKNDSIYSFNVKYNDIQYYFAVKGKYSNSRKNVSDVSFNNIDEYACLGIKALNDDLITQCYKDNDYYDYNYIKGYSINDDVSSTFNDINIYNEDINVYIWNGYGITNVIKNNDINFLSNESYTNNLYYQFDNYLIFADYDSSRTFNKFYVFDSSSDKLSEWKINYDISFDSYFMGDLDGYIYLFDTKNKVEYKLNLNKKKISIVSNDDGGIVYQKEWVDVPIEKLTYNKYYFTKNNVYNFEVINNNLFLSLYNNNYKIKLWDKDIKGIIKFNNETVYFLMDDELYSYDTRNGINKIMEYFEWNFNFENKIFIF